MAVDETRVGEEGGAFVTANGGSREADGDGQGPQLVGFKRESAIVPLQRERALTASQVDTQAGRYPIARAPMNQRQSFPLACSLVITR